MTPTFLGKRKSLWGEGPIWWESALWYVDIEGHALIRLDPRTEEERVWLMEQRIGFARPCRSGRWIWGGDEGLFYLNLHSGVSISIVDPEPNLPNNRFNDAGCSPYGRLFAGTIALDKTPGAAALYRLDERGLKKVRSGVTNSNGIAWSPDGRLCYYIDTPTKQLLRFNYHPMDGELRDEEVWIDFKEFEGSPDGVCMDVEGNLWVAFTHGGCVRHFDMATQEVIRCLELPCMETTAVRLGGESLRDLYVTTGITSKKEEAEAGRIAVFPNQAVAGLPLTPYNDRV